jgi:hypothetical protein
MASTYTPIATQTLGSTTQTVTFSSIPSTYTDLVIVANGTATTAVSVLLRFNGDTASNYSVTYVDGNGTSATSYRDTNYTGGYGGSFYNTTSPTVSTINIMNYANSTTYKTALNRTSYPAGFTIASVSLWRNTAAINSVSMTANLNGFATGTTFTLYGIKAA